MEREVFPYDPDCGKNTWEWKLYTEAQPLCGVKTPVRGYRGDTPRKKGKDNYDLDYFLL